MLGVAVNKQASAFLQQFADVLRARFGMLYGFLDVQLEDTEGGLLDSVAFGHDIDDLGPFRGFMVHLRLCDTVLTAEAADYGEDLEGLGTSLWLLPLPAESAVQLVLGGCPSAPESTVDLLEWLVRGWVLEGSIEDVLFHEQVG